MPGDTKTQTGQQREKAVGGVEAENLAAVFMDEGEDEFQARYRGRKITITGEARSTTSFPLVMIKLQTSRRRDVSLIFDLSFGSRKEIEKVEKGLRDIWEGDRVTVADCEYSEYQGYGPIEFRCPKLPF